MAKTVDYFSQDSDLNLYLHTWTLSLEEQFYFLFPLILYFIGRKSFSRSRAFIVVLVLIVLSLVAILVFSHIGRERLFYYLPFRAWELLIGAALVFFPASVEKILDSIQREILAYISISVIGLYFLYFGANVSHPSIRTVPLCVAAGCLIKFGNTKVSKLLSRPSIVKIGLLSYSIYLYHQPIIAIFKIGSSGLSGGLPFQILIVTLTFGLAWLSWRYVETPIRALAHSWNRSIVVAFALSSGLMLVGTFWLSKLSNSESVYLFRADSEQSKIYNLINKYVIADHYSMMENSDVCRAWAKMLDEGMEMTFSSCWQRLGQKATVVIGDSHSMNFFNVLKKFRVDPFLIGISQGGCRVSDQENPGCDYSKVMRFLSQNGGKISKVIYQQAGFYLYINRDGESGRDIFKKSFSELRFREDAIEKTAIYLDAISSLGLEVIWVGPWASPLTLPNRVRNLVNLEFKIPQSFYDKTVEIDKKLDEVSRLRKYRYVSIHRLVGDNPLQLIQQNCLMFHDEDHLSTCGEDRLATELSNRISL